MAFPRIPFIFFLVLLNAVPVYGVFEWGWKSFDLIYLYWLENLIIGAFMILRFAVRPYRMGMELMFPLCLAPFFALHYGMFCYGHGVFVLSLFGDDVRGGMSSHDVFALILPVIESRHLFWPVLALFAFQLLDWIRDTLKSGLGNEGLRELMTAPYRRIVVLHITIIASGFALMALDEPITGLLILIVLKTAFDLYHWNRDENKAHDLIDRAIDEQTLKKVDAFLDKPSFSINGKEVSFESFDELKASKHYATMMSLYGLMLGNRQLEKVEAYIEQRMSEHPQ